MVGSAISATEARTATASASVPAAGHEDETGLKANAIGFVDALVIGLASTAPAYSLAVVIGLITLVVGPQAPAALLVSFVPMFFIATAFYYMNRADPDAGTTFSWVTRAMGPWAGWLGGWAVCVTGILVIGSLADVGARYTLLLVGWDSAAESKPTVTVFAVLIIVVMTAICILGTELSARIQNVMIIGQVGALLLFAVVALVDVYRGDATDASLRPEASWFSPFEIESSNALFSALLVGVFIYWGWESAVNLCEETKDSRSTPGLAAVFSTGILLVTYVAVGTAVVAFAGLELLNEFADDESIFSVLATDVLGSPWDKLVVLAIVTSAIASSQTTIIPASRTTLSMARSGAFPAILSRIHPRFRTPHVATAAIAALAVLWYVPLNLVSENFLFDTISALSLMIAFYYALSGVACAVYYRRELRKSFRNALFMGVAPLLGAGLLAYLFVEATRALADPEQSYSGGTFLGFGLPLVIGYGFLILGAVLLVAWRLTGHPRFFGRKPFEAVDPAVAEGRVAVEETAGLDEPGKS
ncbi:MAG TPA: APC family permease [Gaiellaceae bacterium]|nr:APC family permease [Gaiellaceae bacterium]